MKTNSNAVPGDPGVDTEAQSLISQVEKMFQHRGIRNLDRKTLRDATRIFLIAAAGCNRAVDWREEQTHSDLARRMTSYEARLRDLLVDTR